MRVVRPSRWPAGFGRMAAYVLAVAFVAGRWAAAGPAPAAGQQPIVLGVPTALGSIEGADSLKAVELAVEEINARGGVAVGGVRRPLSVVAIDTRDHEPHIPTADALAALEKLITERRPHALVVGTFRSEVLLASMDVVARYRIPYLLTIAMTPEFETKLRSDYDRYQYMFRMGLNSPYLVRNLIQLLGFLNERHGLNRVYFVFQDVLWARATANAMENWARQNGWTVVGADAYPTGAGDFFASLSRARSGRAQVIVPIFDMPQSGILIRQARSMQVPALIAGFISPAAPGTAWEAFGSDLDGLVNFIFEAGPIPVPSLPGSIRFSDGFARKYGEEARQKLSGHGPAPSYDAVHVLAAAIERAGSLDADAIVEALKRTDTRGAVGRIRFNENHQVVYGVDPDQTAVSLAFQWRAPGRRMVVFPDGLAEAEIQLPAGVRR